MFLRQKKKKKTLNFNKYYDTINIEKTLNNYTTNKLEKPTTI